MAWIASRNTLSCSSKMFSRPLVGTSWKNTNFSLLRKSAGLININFVRGFASSPFPSLVAQFWHESTKLSTSHHFGDFNQMRILRVFDEIRRISVPPADVYNRVIDVCSKSQQIQKAASLFEEMKKIGISPDLATYKSLIVMYGQRKYIDKVQSLVTEIQNSGMEPNDDLRHELLIAYVENNKFDLAMVEYGKLLQSKKPLSTSVLDTLLNSLFIKGFYDKAIEIYMETRHQIVPTPRMNNIALKVFCKRYKHAEAVQLFWEMKRSQSIPVATHNDLLSLFAKHNMMKELEEIFSDMRLRGPRPDLITYTEMLNFYAFRRVYDKVVELLHEMIANTLCAPPEAYRIALEVMVRDPQAKTYAFDLVEEMQSKKVPISSTHLCELIIKFSGGARSDDTEKLLSLLRLVRERGHNGDSDTSLSVAVIHAFIRLNAIKEARQHFDEALRIFGPRVELFNAILTAYAQDGQYKEALQLLDRIPQEGIEPDGDTYATCLRLVDEHVLRQRKLIRQSSSSRTVRYSTKNNSNTGYQNTSASAGRENRPQLKNTLSSPIRTTSSSSSPPPSSTPAPQQ